MLGILVFISCKKENTVEPPTESEVVEETTLEVKVEPLIAIVPHDVSLGQYFTFLDSLLMKYDTLLPYQIDEHVLVRTNDWIINRLIDTDYYLMEEKGEFAYDNRRLVILHKGDTLVIPDSIATQQICDAIANTTIDVNIPEFKLRIRVGEEVKYTILVRVGRDERKYLELAGREVDLRTATGTGYIYRINRDPIFINPSNGRRFYTTQRDDGKRTRMPQIPWLEPELDGYRYGHLIHPTSNPKTLGKAYSNGCVGLGEADTWRLYYYAPEGTKVVFRYDLKIIDDQLDTIQLKNIYRR